MNSTPSKKFNLIQINMVLTKYLVWALFIIVPTVIWALTEKDMDHFTGMKWLLWEVGGWHFMIWFATLIYLICSLLFSRNYREELLTKLTGSQERDEREAYIGGRASKATFYSTLSAMIFLLFLSGLNVHVFKKPHEETIDVKRGTITIGYQLSFINSAKADESNSKNEEIFWMKGIPFTQESILLFLILFHVGSYHIFSRRQLKSLE